MIIPTKLTVHNYCQITSLSIDFTEADIFALTAPNAFGKSNSVFALRYAFTNMASPGAKRLTDDIRDGQKTAQVKLDFDVVGSGRGSIYREIGKNGSSCELILEFDGENVEKITKSGAAEKRFQELLGVSPKYISEVVISDQYNIASLLFWPAAERGPKFQRFLHGIIFSEVEALVQKQRKKLSLDANASHRLESLNQLLKANKDKAVQAKTSIQKSNAFLSKSTTVAVITKAENIKEHAQLSIKYNELVAVQEELENEVGQLDTQIKASNVPSQQERAKLKASIVTTRNAWDTYRPFRDAQKELARIKAKLSKDTTKLKVLDEKLALEEVKRADVTSLENSKKAFELDANIQENKQLVEFSNDKLKEVTTHLEALIKDKSEIIKILEVEPTFHLIHEGWKHAKTHKTDQCVLCGGIFPAAKFAELEKEKDRLEKLIQSARGKLDKTISDINKDEKEIALLNQAKARTQTELNTFEEVLSKLGKSTIIWNELAQEQLVNTTQFLASLEEIRSQKNELTIEIRNDSDNSSKLERLPIVKQPDTTEEDLKIDEAKLDAIDKAQEAIQIIKESFILTSGKMVSYAKLITEASLTFQAKGLPKPNTVFKLGEKEIEIQARVFEVNEVLSQESSNLAGYDGSITTLLLQISHAEKEIAGFNDTKAYLADLEQLESWFKYNGIPSQILKIQLNNLCQKMGTIVSNFQLQQQFKLIVDESLEVYMQYPSGSVRTIQKASGGERMILGLAFRLATHQYLAPELPILVIDEPSNHLHESNQVVLQELIRSLKTNLKTYGLRKFIYCTHSNALAGEAEKIINLSESI